MKRVICLYRVSSKQQVDKSIIDDKESIDIPMQRNACREYCIGKDWKIIREIQEAAVSAYSNPTFSRNAIKELLLAASNKEFDILLVFALDRLSRRDTEFPMLVQMFTRYGVSIWSVVDGECSYITSTDRLMTFIAGWKACCESERLGQRISESMSQMTLRGEYCGGPLPFGYRTQETGRIKKRGNAEKVIVVNEPEADIIRMIYRLIIDDNYTVYHVSKFLQTYNFPDGVRKQSWRKTTIVSILNNAFYIGCVSYGDKTSMPFERLQIISPDDFELAKAKISKRVSRKSHGYHTPEVKPSPHYHDLVFCGHCNSRLVFSHAFQKNKSGGSSIRYLYRCYNKERFDSPCTGPSTYSAAIIDLQVRTFVYDLAKLIMSNNPKLFITNAVEHRRIALHTITDSLTSEVSSLQAEVEILQAKIVESLSNYGIPATTPLQLLYDDMNARLMVKKSDLEQKKSCRFNEKTTTREISNSFDELLNKCKTFVELTPEDASSHISDFIRVIRVSSNYHIEVDLLDEVNEFVPNHCKTINDCD